MVLRRATIIVLALGAPLGLGLAAPQPASAAIRPWNATFATNFGAVTFRQSGAVVTGRYRWAGGGTLRARVRSRTPRTLSGTFRDRSGTGTFRIVINPSLTRFTGSYANRTTGRRGRWSGTRRGAVPIRFVARAYANNVRVLPPLVADFQLGVARWSGRGLLRPGRPFAGRIVDTDVPRDGGLLRVGMVVTGWRIRAGNVRTVLALDVRTTSSNRTESCAVGTVGRVVLNDDTRRLANGATRDSVGQTFPLQGGVRVAPDGGASCRAHVQGWNNRDPGPRARPPTGGPGGGQWADVRVTVG